MENQQRGVFKVYLVCVLGMVVGSFISPLIKLIIQTGVDAAVITFYRLLFVSVLVLPVLFSKWENREKVKAMTKTSWLQVIGERTRLSTTLPPTCPPSRRSMRKTASWSGSGI